MKTVLLVPGFREDISSRDYKSTISAIEGKGYRVEFVSIDWFRTRIKDWTEELNRVYSNYAAAETILAGFSLFHRTSLMTFQILKNRGLLTSATVVRTHLESLISIH